MIMALAQTDVGSEAALVTGLLNRQEGLTAEVEHRQEQSGASVPRRFLCSSGVEHRTDPLHLRWQAAVISRWERVERNIGILSRLDETDR